MIRPYQQALIDRATIAMSKPTVNHIGLTMPTGTGISTVVAEIARSQHTANSVGATRHNHPVDIVVVGLPEMRQQMVECLAPDSNSKFIISQIGFGVEYAKAVERCIPRHWDLTIVTELPGTTQPKSWWFNEMTLIVNPNVFMMPFIDHSIELRHGHRGGAQLIETSRFDLT